MTETFRLDVSGGLAGNWTANLVGMARSVIRDRVMSSSEWGNSHRGAMVLGLFVTVTSWVSVAQLRPMNTNAPGCRRSGT